MSSAELNFDLDAVRRLVAAPVTPLAMPRFRGRARVGRFRAGQEITLFGKRLEDATSYANEVASLRMLSTPYGHDLRTPELFAEPRLAPWGAIV